MFWAIEVGEGKLYVHRTEAGELQLEWGVPIQGRPGTRKMKWDALLKPDEARGLVEFLKSQGF